MIYIELSNVLQAINQACERIGRPRVKEKKNKNDNYVFAYEKLSNEEKQKIVDILLQIIDFYQLSQVKIFFHKRPRSRINFFTNHHIRDNKFYQHFLCLRKDGIYWFFEKKDKQNREVYLKLPLNANDLITFLKKETELVKKMLVDLQIMTSWAKEKFNQQIINSVLQNKATHAV